ncbi:type IV secretion system protein [Asticcacaulis sp. W401b]|uniref:type IV secretion system protein n=1 Tax=Asticcacaulis sp. W401b TaxID=3388666 RepID=UPI0039709D6A
MRPAISSRETGISPQRRNGGLGEMEQHFLEGFERGMDLRLAQYLSSTIANLCTILSPVVASAIVIYIILIGYAVMRGEAQDSLHASVWKVVKWSLVSAVALSAGGFNSHIVGGLNGLETALFQATTGAQSGGALLDATLSSFIELFKKLNENMKSDGMGIIPNFVIVIAVLILSVATLVFFGFAVCVFMLGKVAGVLVIALGPAFLATLIFPPVQRFADAWLSAALNAILIKVLGGMVLSISTLFLSGVVDAVVANFDATSIAVNVIEVLILSVAFGFILGYLPMLAAQLVGGSPMPHLTAPRIRLGRRSKPAQHEGGALHQTSAPSHPSATSLPASPATPVFRRNVLENLNPR